MLQDATRRWRSSKATKQTRTRRCKTFKCCKMLLEDEGDETRPRGCKYPTPPFALAKILPETTVRAFFRQIENASPITNTFRLLLGVEDTAHVTIERRLINLLCLLFSSFFWPFLLYCFTSSVSSTPSRNPYFLLFQQIFFVLVCIHPGTPRVPPRVLAGAKR